MSNIYAAKPIKHALPILTIFVWISAAVLSPGIFASDQGGQTGTDQCDQEIGSGSGDGEGEGESGD